MASHEDACTSSASIVMNVATMRIRKVRMAMLELHRQREKLPLLV
jgi:hypothetical protein